jgi:hypothetical protein
MAGESGVERRRQQVYAAMAVTAASAIVLVVSLAFAGATDSAVFKFAAAVSFCLVMLGLFFIRFGWRVALF